MAKITRFKEYSFTESIVDDFINHFYLSERAEGGVEPDYSPEVDEIIKRFKSRFGNKKPTITIPCPQV